MKLGYKDIKEPKIKTIILIFSVPKSHNSNEEETNSITAKAQGVGVGGVALEAEIFFREAQSPIASLLGALILFYCRAWSPQNVCCGARSPKY